jgi:hypothetical protein
MNSIKVLFFIFFFLFLCRSASAEAIHRHILAVVDGAENLKQTAALADAIPGEDEHYAASPAVREVNTIEQYAEMPLNYLGYVLDYVDVTKRLPDDGEMAKYDAIITWFGDNTMKGAPDYGRWITRQLAKGKKLIAIGEFGFDLDEHLKPIPQEILDQFFKAFSIAMDPGDTTDSPLLIEVVSNDPAMTEFERSLKGELTNFTKISVTDGGAKVYLRLRRKDTRATADAVFVHAKGAFVLPGYAYYLNAADFQTRWRIDPFRFFAAALGAAFPKPDVTTLNGMRLFFSHIDGDGFANRSLIDREQTCAALTYEKILTKYRLPISASIIVGTILRAQGEEREHLISLAKKIFALPNVEAASHGWSHPLVWASDHRKLAIKLKGFVYSPESEIGNSIRYINDNLMPRGKQTNLFFWTGDCLPDAEALEYVHRHGIQAMNGGDTRFDNAYPSYTYVSPLFRHLGGLLQDYAADSNEVTYTNIWTGPFYGFRYAIETYERTEAPLRVKPIDIYYHFFSMERESSYAALKQVYDWALPQEIAPVFASEYLRSLRGFVTTRIERMAPDRWIVSDNGDLRTVRFDVSDRYVNMQASKGVLGCVRHQGALYVHLDNGRRSEIALASSRPAIPYLVKANGMVRTWRRSSGVHFELRSIGRVQFAIGGLRANRVYRVTVGGNDDEIKTDAKGELAFSGEIKTSGFEWTRIAIVET